MYLSLQNLLHIKLTKVMSYQSGEQTMLDSFCDVLHVMQRSVGNAMWNMIVYSIAIHDGFG